jgi:hypothetical protein
VPRRHGPLRLQQAEDVELAKCLAFELQVEYNQCAKKAWATEVECEEEHLELPSNVDHPCPCRTCEQQNSGGDGDLPMAQALLLSLRWGCYRGRALELYRNYVGSFSGNCGPCPLGFGGHHFCCPNKCGHRGENQSPQHLKWQ